MQKSKATAIAPNSTVQTYNHWLDIGNYSVQSVHAGVDLLTVRSLVYPLTYGETPLGCKRSEESPLIVYEGKTYHAGEAALSYPNGSEATVKGDKTRLSKQIELMLAVSQPGIESVNLVMTVPDPHEEVQIVAEGSVLSQQTVAGACQALVGDYSFIRNGTQHNLTVQAVTVVQEGLPAVLKARRDGGVPNQGTTVCLDIGGKTCNLLVVDDAGDVVGYMSMLGAGGIKLATALQSNGLYRTRCKRARVSVPTVERIMSAIASGNSYAGCNVEAHWADILPEELNRWYTSLVGDVEATLGTLDSDLTGLMLTGGSANLFHQLSDAYIPAAPESFNITALSQGYGS